MKMEKNVHDDDVGEQLFRSFYQALPHRDPFPVWRMYDAKKKTPLRK